MDLTTRVITFSLHTLDEDTLQYLRKYTMLHGLISNDNNNMYQTMDV